MRKYRDWSSGAWVLLGWYALLKFGNWLALQVANHTPIENAMWYEVVIALIGVFIAIGAVVGGVLTLLGVYDRR